jgi:hypothetical protein
MLQEKIPYEQLLSVNEIALRGDALSEEDVAVLLSVPNRLGAQQYLWVRVHQDDLELLRSKDAAWFLALLTLDWEPYREFAAQYYQALYDFNQKAARQGVSVEQLVLPFLDKRVTGGEETKEEAAARLLKERPTGGNKEAPIIYDPPHPPEPNPHVVRVENLSPGCVPYRMAGRQPKCFFALFKAFIGAPLLGKSATAEEVSLLLRVSPPYARACGFTLPCGDGSYCQSDVPSLRKLEQFDQVMSAAGIWYAARVDTVRQNIKEKIVKLETCGVVDTTHYHAASSFKSVPVESPKAAKDQKKDDQSKKERKERKKGKGKKGKGKKGKGKKGKGPKKRGREVRKQAKQRRKSQSKVTKECRCEDWSCCDHDWVLADPGAGTVVKGGAGGKRMYWAHKVSILGLAVSGIPIDAVTMTDAASHDSQALPEHLESLLEKYPEFIAQLDEVLVDSAYDDKTVRAIKVGPYTITIRAVPNIRRLKTMREGLPKGMATLTPTGVLECVAGYEMPYLGRRLETSRYLYGPPEDEDGECPCDTCPLRAECCRQDSTTGRHVTVPFDLLPAINSADPAMAKRFKTTIRHRTSIERAIKRLKLDFGSPRLSRRGHAACQAHVDKSLLALHILLRL